MTRFTGWILGFVIATVSPAFAKSPGLPESPAPQGRELTPMQRDYHEMDETTPSLGSGLWPNSSRKSDKPGQPDVKESTDWTRWLTKPLGLAEQGMWISK